MHFPKLQSGFCSVLKFVTSSLKKPMKNQCILLYNNLFAVCSDRILYLLGGSSLIHRIVSCSCVDRDLSSRFIASANCTRRQVIRSSFGFLSIVLPNKKPKTIINNYFNQKLPNFACEMSSFRVTLCAERPANSILERKDNYYC